MFYYFKTEEYPEKNFSEKRQMGFIAQKIENQSREIASLKKENERLRIEMESIKKVIKDQISHHATKSRQHP